MKTHKLLKLSQEVISDKKSKNYKQKKCLKDLQIKLKKKGKKLKERIENESDVKDKKAIEKQLKIIYAQRKKIINALKDLS